MGEEGSTLHLLQPDGNTMTVQFITGEDGESYITHSTGGEQQFIATDEVGDYITGTSAAQFILALQSGAQQFITTGPSQEFLPADAETFVAEEGLEQVGRIEETESETPLGIHSRETQAPIQEQSEQERQQCANCYSKLIFQRGRSRKFSEYLYISREYSGEKELSNKHYDKAVTVLEALDLLFDLKIKSLSSHIRLCEDYVFCYRCVSSLVKLHSVFMEFTAASKSPSFMKSIFSQYGVLNEFKNVIQDLKQEGVEKGSETVKSDPFETCQEVEAAAELKCDSNLKEANSVERDETRVSTKRKLRRQQGSVQKTRRSLNTSASSSSRLPRSCKKPKNYRALAKVGQYDSEGEGSTASNDDEISEKGDAGNTLSSDKERSDSLGKPVLSVPFKKRRSRLLSLKNRIKEITNQHFSPEDVTVEKRKPGRPRKVTVSAPAELNPETPEAHEPRPLKKRKYDEPSVKIEVMESLPEDGQEEAQVGLASFSCAESESSSKDVLKNEAASDEEAMATDEDSEVEFKPVASKIATTLKRPKKLTISCKKCCAKFQKQSHYIDHLRVHSDDKLVSSECNGTFNTERNLKRHISLYHRARPRFKVATERQFTCPECGFSFTRKSHLQAHLVNQHSLDPDAVLTDFPCQVCGKKNFTDVALQAHLNRKHLVRVRERKNACEECGRRFLKKSDLENHMTTHTNIRRFMCEVCGFSSKRPQDLTRHRKLVHLKEVKHTCQTCGKGFLSLWQMKSHQLSHDEFKGFPCPEEGCGKSFRCPNNLRQHIHVHQGVKHVCQYCGESYSRTAYLHRHIKVNHLGTDAPPVKTKRGKETNNPNILRNPRPKKPKKTYEVLENAVQIIDPEPLELDIDLPTEDGHTQQVILHGFDDRYEGVIMEYIIG